MFIEFTHRGKLSKSPEIMREVVSVLSNRTSQGELAALFTQLTASYLCSPKNLLFKKRKKRNNEDRIRGPRDWMNMSTANLPL